MDIVAEVSSKVLNNRDNKKAEIYLKNRNIKKLVNHLTTKILVEKPNDPVTFTILQIEQLINFRDNRGKPPVLFDDEQLVAIYNNTDILKAGSISIEQYVNAMDMLGLNNEDFNTNPKLNENNCIERKTFLQEVKLALIKRTTSLL
ncbi:uncharacterized protein LOC126907050 isoform X2 [Daktulosphaira vitifoliae]|uniref:uncharacterized protein LOC126907050 isoform X2 n=1 Tax=Daktulosphaira vitifoliae TaxID=58002 RepID=UPI0021AAE9B2|nr:uncharacterized protein LOC126907050 isoform X2 [Daktulosphaira vitifoliae]